MNSIYNAVICLILCAVFMAQKSIAQIPFTTQPEKTRTREGNKEFMKNSYADAEASYKKALDKKNNMPEAIFNLGDAVYQQKRYEEAAKQFQLSAQTNPDVSVQAKAYHNLGNTFLEQQKWADAVKAYKSALKLNSKDTDTKYNLAYANAMLQQQQGGAGGNDQNQKDKKEDKKDQQNQENNNQKQDEQQAKQQDSKEQQQGKQQQAKLSKEEAEKLLQALMNEEQKTNQKMQEKQMKAVRIKVQKDW